MLENEKIKVINFLQDFGCATLEQLQILFNKPNDNFKYILTRNIISRKGNIFVHNAQEIDMKMIYALDVLCKYKGRYKQFYKGFFPIYITFLAKDNTLYNIIVTDKENEKGLLKLLRVNSPIISEADKFILLFQDINCFKELECNVPYIYCVYPELKIINTSKNEKI